jgi:DNA-binding transcriptional ArsR family regulator
VCRRDAVEVDVELPWRAVVERLAVGSASVSDLAAPFAISLTAMRKHLRVLERSGVVITEKRGRVRHCRLADAAPLSVAHSWLEQRLALWQGRFDSLGRHLDQTAGGTAESTDGAFVVQWGGTS